MKKPKVIQRQYTVSGTTNGKPTSRIFAKLPEARAIGRKLFRLGRFTSLTTVKGTLLPL